MIQIRAYEHNLLLLSIILIVSTLAVVNVVGISVAVSESQTGYAVKTSNLASSAGST